MTKHTHAHGSETVGVDVAPTVLMRGRVRYLWHRGVTELLVNGRVLHGALVLGFERVLDDGDGNGEKLGPPTDNK